MNDIKKRLRLEALLKDKPHTYQQLADKLKTSYELVARYVKKLYDADAVHVHGWAEGKDGRHTVAIISWGKAADAPRPPADTAAQRMARTRANRRAA